MKKILSTFMRPLAVALLLSMVSVAWAANSTKTVTQVSSAVSVTTDLDYTVSDATPFTSSGVVDIVNTDHAVLILKKTKPSAALRLLADHVKINGEKAVNGTNCQVKIYGQGSIILPYGNRTQPLTVYSEQNFEGEACSDFGLENTNGFMNTLTDEKLNNRIRSFKLKRGYMVTFALRPGGYGYSRCFIAANEDLEMSTLPEILDKRISSYRIFKWYDASKKGLANDTRNEAVSALNVTSCYSFGLGEDKGPDVECVPHHIYEDWPSAQDCGKVTYSPHLKTNNEPGNSADDHPQSVETILNNWEKLMATGMRLCSPSSHDGSLGHLREFLDSIDKRGWRCDIIDLHCYWKEWNLKNMVKGWYDDYKNRPIWISEWVWGSSWNNDGIFSEASSRDNPTANDYQKNKDVIKGVCETWNGANYIERYFYWNSEANCSKLYLSNGTLTTAGDYYANTNNPGLAYNKTAAKYVPSVPTINAPALSAITAAGKVSLQWSEKYGELTQRMMLEYSSNGSTWQAVETYEQSETPRNLTHEASMGEGKYRVHTVDYKGVNHYSATITIAGTSYYLYNIGAKQWLCCGNSWGSHASLTQHGGYDVLVAEAGSGKYTIDTQLVNGDNHYLNVLDNGPWMDQTKGTWTFTEAGTDNGQTTYLLTCNGSNLAYDGSTTSLTATSEKGVNAQWIFQTRDDRMKLLETASEDNPVDATFLIAGNHFDRYDLRNNVWQGGLVLDGFYDGNSGNQVTEKYSTAPFDVYQTISGAPAGNYRLLVQGYYRNGSYADAAKLRKGGTEKLNALFYANDKSAPLQSIFTEAGKLDVGKTTSGISGKFPDSMSDAAQFFLKGLYDNALEFTLDEGEELRIGVKKSVATDKDWTCFDNFRLIYLGGNILPGDVNGDGKVDIVDVTSTISYILGQKPMPFDEKAADVNNDGKIDIVDVTSIIDLVLGVK